MATLGANIAPFLGQLDTAKGEAKKKGEGIGSALGEELTGKLKGLVAFGAVEEAIRRTVEYGARIQELSNRLGISTTAAQQWDYALKQNGSSLENAAGFFEKLAVARDKVMKGGEKGAVLEASFAKLGVSVQQLKNARLEDIGATIAKVFESGDPQALIGSLRAVGGRGAGELVSAFRDGFAGLLDEAPLISPEDIAHLKEAKDAIAQLGAEITSGLAPAIAGAAEAAKDLFHGLDAAAGVGFATAFGVFRELKNLWENGKVDFGSIKKDAINALLEKAKEEVARRDADKSKADRLAKGRLHSVGDDDEAGSEHKTRTAKQEQEDENKLDGIRAKSADRVQKIHEQIAEIQRKAAMQSMTADEKRVALAQEIAKLKKERDPYGGWTDEEIAMQDKSIAEREAELAGIKKDKALKVRDIGVNPLQAAGMLLGGLSNPLETASLDTAKKSQGHLARIEKGIERISAPIMERLNSAFEGTEF